MDTKLVNSRLISRKDVRVWFFDGGEEFRGNASVVAENGVIFAVKLEPPKTADPLSYWSELRTRFKGKTLTVELSSPRTKREFKVLVCDANGTPRKGALTLTATFASPPDAAWLKVLLEPVVTAVPKKNP